MIAVQFRMHHLSGCMRDAKDVDGHHLNQKKRSVLITVQGLA